MDLRQLEYFVRVAEIGSFTKAAMLLSVAQPALSKQVRLLEVELRQTLLHRNGRGVSLTNEGTLLFGHAKGILEQVSRAKNELNDSKESPVGKVIIGAPPSVGKGLTALLVTTFRKQFPRAELEIIEAKSWSIYDWILSGRIDIGILYDPRISPLIDITSLADEEIFLVSAVAHPALPPGKTLRPRDLGKFPLILPSFPHAMRSLVESAAANAGTKLNVTLQIEGAHFILELVRHGHGCSTLPLHVIQESRFANKLQTNAIVRPQLSRNLIVAVSSQRPITRLARETMRLIQTYFGGNTTHSV